MAWERKKWEPKFHKFEKEHEKVPMGPPCFLDITEDDKPIGRVVIQPRDDVVPYTCENFRKYITAKDEKSYKGKPFHRIIKDFIVQTGDAENGNGTGKMSMFDDVFQDENFDLCHAPYTVSMANSGPNTNGCIFFILLMEAPWMDGTYVVFGHVTEGKDVLAKMNAQSRKSGRMFKHFKVENCGELSPSLK